MSHIVKAGEVPSGKFDSEGDETDDSGDPHQTLQPSSQLPGKLHVLWSSFRRLQFIGTISLQDLTGIGGGQTLRKEIRRRKEISEQVWQMYKKNGAWKHQCYRICRNHKEEKTRVLVMG